MNVVKVSVLLVLVAIGSNAAPNTTECDGLPNRLQAKDLHKIFGDWVLVWAISDSDVVHSLMANLSSSHVEFKPHADGKTIEYNERNAFLGSLVSCTTYFISATKPSENDTEHLSLHADVIRLEKDGVVQEYNDTGDIDFYEPCTDCLLLIYKSSEHRYFLSYRKEGSHRDVEQQKAAHDDHKKLTACMKFLQDKPYIYDGVADFCHKKSAPDANAKES